MGHSIVHNEKASLDKPYGQDLHLFHDKDELGAIDSVLDLCAAIPGDILAWWN
jgi:hypothetical protein